MNLRQVSLPHDPMLWPFGCYQGRVSDFKLLGIIWDPPIHSSSNFLNITLNFTQAFSLPHDPLLWSSGCYQGRVIKFILLRMFWDLPRHSPRYFFNPSKNLSQPFNTTHISRDPNSLKVPQILTHRTLCSLNLLLLISYIMGKHAPFPYSASHLSQISLTRR